MPYDINAIRNNIKKAVSGKFVDPDEFRPDKAKSNTEALKYRFFVLPPLKKGDVLKSGVVEHDMDNFFIPHGQHWINDRPHPCPRVWDGSECAVCNYAFDLLKECKEKKLGDERKTQICRQWLPSTYYMVNIFFTNSKINPEELRGKVKFYNAPKTCLDKWMSTLMKDDLGDDEDPDAYGVFFDENAAFAFELAVLKEGKSNGYKTSAFVKNGGVPVPMIINQDQSPNTKAINALLQARLNLFDKIEKPDSAKIQRIASVMISGDDDEDGNAGFDADETVESSQPQVSTVPPKLMTEKAKPATKPRKEAKETDEDLVTDFVTEEEPPKKNNPPVSDKNTSQDEDDIGGDDIEALLSQLDD